MSFKGPRSSCQLVFHQCNGGPILCCLSSREGIVHLRRGLHPLRYHGVHALRYHLHARRGRSSGQMRATTELIGLARRIPSTRSAACRVLSDGELLPGCFQLATSSWLTSPLVCTAATKPSSGLHDGRKAHQDRRYRQLQLRGSCLSRRRSTAFHICGSSTSVGFVTGIPSATASPSKREVAWFTSSPPILRQHVELLISLKSGRRARQGGDEKTARLEGFDGCDCDCDCESWCFGFSWCQVA